MFMPSIKSIIFLCTGLVAGGLLHAWISGEPAKPFQSMSGPLESLNYYELLTDKEFNTHAANFLLEQDENCPETPAERVVSLVLLHQRNPDPDLSGVQVTSYATRYHGAQALLTDHLIKDSPAAHQARVGRLRRILRNLVEAEAEYCANVFAGSGSYRDRMMEHNRVEDTAARWALRLAKETGQRNPDADTSFVKLRQRLAADQEILGSQYDDQVIGELRLQNAAERRPLVVLKLRALTEELKNWPPEVTEELAPLILKTFQE